MITILDAIEDVFPAWFKDRETWQPWFTFLRALFALPMSESELALYRQCTGRKEPPSHPVQEAWLVIGRRGGKSFTLALIAVFLACFHEYREHLNKGERGTVMVIAQDRRQARVIMRFIRALLQVPMLARMAEREVAEGFDLNNQITIEIHVASFRSTRGYTLVAGLLDEVAFWPSEGAAEPDYEVINALRPGMATGTRCDVAVCFVTLWTQGCLVGGLSPVLRQRRSVDLAGPHTGDEPDCAGQ